MDVSASMEAPVGPDRLFTLVEELTEYPRWMPLAHRVVPLTVGPDALPAFEVEIRARLGPLARSKRLRMVRSGHDVTTHRVRFERHETDGRRHAPWILDAQVVAVGSGSRLVMQLHYGGKLWGGGLMEKALADQIVAGCEQLLALLARPEA